jgi:hypothetical protein
MKRGLRVFFAGKIDPLSPYAPAGWRERLAERLQSNVRHFELTNASSVTERSQYILEQGLPLSTIFAQDCFYIQQSDVLVVNLTDDISVGGSQEIFIAKQFGIPVIGLAPRGGKFHRLMYELGGKKHWNWIHPFVAGLCDLVVHDEDELAFAIEQYDDLPRTGIKAIAEAVTYYQKRAGGYDFALDELVSFKECDSSRQKLRIYFAGKMGKADGFSKTKWRDQLASMISRESRFEAVDMDFLRQTHPYVDESDGKLIFGRDSYLIRSADAVVVNLSDDISVGGAVEMMIAKLYHRPVIALARPGGKFVQASKQLFGRNVANYVNPFVFATSDWLLPDAADLPKAIDKLHTGTVKTHHIINTSAKWYQQTSLRTDRHAQALFANL